MMHVREPRSGGEYYLYLPEDYVKDERPDKGGRKWPVVVTLHGMKPFDSASAQIREWQQEADRYGYVVIAPELSSPDLMSEFPVRTVHPGVKHDEQITIAALDDTAKRASIDTDHVLSTSWSSGGYIAHYIANRYPERFSCIAPRQSNFSAAILDPANVERYRNNKIGIFYTQNDFAICKRESQEAARWYSRHGFDVTFAVFSDLGHERRPAVAAAFFAKTCGAVAKSPPTEIARMQVKEIPHLAGDADEAPKPAATTVSEPARRQSNRSMQPPAAQASPRKRRPAPLHLRDQVAGNPAQRAATSNSGSSQSVAARNNQGRPSQTTTPTSHADAHSPLQIRLSSDTGVAPLLVNFSANIASNLSRGAYYLWTSNGMPVSNGSSGRKLYTEPGEYEIGCLMTTETGVTFNSSATVRVLDPRTAVR